VTSEYEYLGTDDLIDLATGLLGAPAPIRDVGLLGSAAARPRATAFGDDAYPDLWTKAAALLQSILKDYALIDGNKRLGWPATAVFLEINGVETRVPNDAIYELVTDLAGVGTRSVRSRSRCDGSSSTEPKHDRSARWFLAVTGSHALRDVPTSGARRPYSSRRSVP
jgi:death-on-curing protein